MKPHYAQHEQIYQQIRAKGWSGWGGNHRIDQVSQIIERLLASGFPLRAGEALELGCGEGSVTRHLAALGFKVTGIDISPTAIAWAREKTTNDTQQNCTFMCHDLTQIALPSQAFDLVVDGNCLHCIIGPDRQTLLSNVFNALRNKGFFFVSSLCAPKEQVLEREGMAYRHIRTPEQIQRELTDSGFNCLKVNRYTYKEHQHVTFLVQRCVN